MMQYDIAKVLLTEAQILSRLDELAGPAVFGEDGAAISGIILRYLYLPDHLAEASSVFKWIARELGGDTYVELIPCYIPAYQAQGDPKLGRRVVAQDVEEVLKTAKASGLQRLVAT